MRYEHKAQRQQWEPCPVICKRCGHRFTTRTVHPNCSQCGAQGWDQFRMAAKATTEQKGR